MSGAKYATPIYDDAGDVELMDLEELFSSDDYARIVLQYEQHTGRIISIEGVYNLYNAILGG